MKSKYVLTFEFKVLYCPNINLPLTCKELNAKTLEFTQFEGKVDEFNSGYEITADLVEKIVKNILNGEIGIELSSDNMKWLETFDKTLIVNKSILNNENLLFNYLILKLMLLGFDEELAQDIIKTYFLKRKNGNVLPIDNFISIINNRISEKKFWVCYNLFDEKEKEFEFIRTILNYKQKLQFRFDFSVFKDEYLKLCNESLIPKLIKFNQTPSYLIRNSLSIKEQKPYLLKAYITYISNSMNFIYENEFNHLFLDTRFLSAICKDMASVVELFISIKESQ